MYPTGTFFGPASAMRGATVEMRPLHLRDAITCPASPLSGSGPRERAENRMQSRLTLTTGKVLMRLIEYSGGLQHEVGARRLVWPKTSGGSCHSGGHCKFRSGSALHLSARLQLALVSRDQAALLFSPARAFRCFLPCDPAEHSADGHAETGEIAFTKDASRHDLTHRPYIFSFFPSIFTQSVYLEAEIGKGNTGGAHSQEGHVIATSRQR